MDKKIARKINKAIIETNHPVLDFRTTEAKTRTKWIKKYLKPYINKKCRALDLGCGAGKQSFELECLGAEVTGIDCSRNAIDYAKKIKNNIGSNCLFFVGDFAKIPFQRSTFDLVIFPNNIIECSYDEIEKLTIEIKRILRKNGFFILTMEDGLNKMVRNKNFDNNFDFDKGVYNSYVKIPKKKEYAYPTYFWTIPFAKHIFQKQFKLVDGRKIEEEKVLLVFKNK